MLTTLAERIRERLDALKMTDAQLARATGIKPPSVFLWLDGTTKSIKGENLLRAAKALGVTPEWLTTGIGKKFPDDPSGSQAAQQQHAYYGDPSIAEAIKLLESMTHTARLEALSFLKVFAAKKGASKAHREGVSLPAAKHNAA